MNAKEYLMQVQKINSLIENTQNEIDFWKAMAEKTTKEISGVCVQSSGDKRPMESAVCKYSDLQAESSAYIDELVNIKRDIINIIRRLPVDQFKILHDKYIGKVIKQPESLDDSIEIKYLTFDEIAENMKKSRKWVTDKHGEAIANVQRALNERERND